MLLSTPPPSFITPVGSSSSTRFPALVTRNFSSITIFIVLLFLQPQIRNNHHHHYHRKTQSGVPECCDCFCVKCVTIFSVRSTLPYLTLPLHYPSPKLPLHYTILPRPYNALPYPSSKALVKWKNKEAGSTPGNQNNARESRTGSQTN